MIPTRHSPALAIRFSLTAIALLALPSTVESARAQDATVSCQDAAELAILPVPVAPWKGAPLRVIFAAEKPLDGELSLTAPDGNAAAASRDRRGGPPYFWIVEVSKPRAGMWRATLTRDTAPANCKSITREIAVRDDEPPKPTQTAGSVWPLRGSWNRATENLYSAWIEKLFDSPLDDPPSWKALHEVLRDKSRNVLFNYLGLNEDEMKQVFKPDCADMPYFLRAYFAFKMGLPFGYSKCTRGTATGAPRCPQWFNIQNLEPPRAPPPEKLEADEAPPPTTSLNPFASASRAPAPPPPPPPAPVTPKRTGLFPAFAQYIPVIGDSVHSGSGRTAATDDNTDYYPVALSQETLRPGTMYADPYGHLLMLTRRVAQTGDNAGVFLAADAQPDGTVAIKRFWRGNFLFAQEAAFGGAGFKHFRPIVRTKDGNLRRLTNAEISRDPEYGDFSLEQSKMGVEEFYDRMDDVQSPSPLDPFRATKEAIIALDEQVKARVTSVENGRKYLNSGKGEASMPEGPAIFETTGAWEDFATPSRDLRILIAIDVVRGFPDRVARKPERYAMPKDKSVAEVKTELQSMLSSELATRKFSYTRTDGSPWALSVKDVLDRAPLLEMAYNVNDCVELRWGADAKSDESSTCKKHAPAAQRAKMDKYRVWFHERKRPVRMGGA
ncbi:MAG: hypothetical protein HY242_08665 [Afipia sp.]|nr:hypothetical protein [Afipia sp.]